MSNDYLENTKKVLKFFVNNGEIKETTAIRIISVLIS